MAPFVTRIPRSGSGGRGQRARDRLAQRDVTARRRRHRVLLDGSEHRLAHVLGQRRGHASLQRQHLRPREPALERDRRHLAAVHEPGITGRTTCEG